MVSIAMLATAPAGAHDAARALTSTSDGAPWTFEPWAVALLVASAMLYVLGLVRLWRIAGPGHGVSIAQAVRFALGWLTLAAALVSPLDSVSERAFSAHMVQHELFMLVAAPPLASSRPLGAFAWGLGPLLAARAGGALRNATWRRFWRMLCAPVCAWVLHAAALWIWHVPALFDAALRSEAWHIAQHLSFFATALLFWWSVLKPRTNTGRGIAVLSLFATMMQTGALGVLLALSNAIWYAPYLAPDAASPFGLTPLEEQQLGGLVMWVPASLVYLAVALAIGYRWLAPTKSRLSPRLAADSGFDPDYPRAR